MSGALTVSEAVGPTLAELLVETLAHSRRPARTATCPVCNGTMRRLVDAAGGHSPALGELVCGECGSVLSESSQAAAGQLRLVG